MLPDEGINFLLNPPPSTLFSEAPPPSGCLRVNVSGQCAATSVLRGARADNTEVIRTKQNHQNSNQRQEQCVTEHIFRSEAFLELCPSVNLYVCIYILQTSVIYQHGDTTIYYLHCFVIACFASWTQSVESICPSVYGRQPLIIALLFYTQNY